MYQLNTILRVIRFVANSLIGLALGFVIGVFYATGNVVQLLQWLHLK